MKRYIFPDPMKDADCTLQPDSLPAPIVGVPDVHPDGNKPCVSFDVPDSVPTGNGAWLKVEWPKGAGLAPYALHGFLDTVTPGGGGFACDIFRGQKVGGVRPFELDGHFCRYSDDGTEMLINETTGFRAFARYVDQQAAALDAFMESCVAHRFNMIRVAAMQDTTLYLSDPALRYRIHPHDHQDFYRLVDGFMDYTASYGVYVDWMNCTQTQTILPNRDDQVWHTRQMFEVLHSRFCFDSKVNEQYQHDNSVEPAVLVLPKPAGATFLLSTGSKGAGDESAIEPVGDLVEYHTNDVSEWHRKGGHNSWEIGNRYNRAAYPSEETRTDKDGSLIHFEDAGKSEAAMCLACMLHSPEGKNADPFAFSVPHIEAHNRGVFDGGHQHRRGPYARYNNPDVLREYSMGAYRWQVRF